MKTKSKTINKNARFWVVFISFLFIAHTAIAAQIILKETDVESTAATISIPISLMTTSIHDIASFECTVNYDQTIVTFSGTTLTTNIVQSQKVIETNNLSDHEVKILVYGLNNQALADGDVIYLDFNIMDPIPGQINIRITDFVASCPNCLPIPNSIDNQPISIDGTFPAIAITYPACGDIISRTSTIVRGTVDDSITDVTIRVENDSFSNDYCNWYTYFERINRKTNIF